MNTVLFITGAALSVFSGAVVAAMLRCLYSTPYTGSGPNGDQAFLPRPHRILLAWSFALFCGIALAVWAWPRM